MQRRRASPHRSDAQRIGTPNRRDRINPKVHEKLHSQSPERYELTIATETVGYRCVWQDSDALYICYLQNSIYRITYMFRFQLIFGEKISINSFYYKIIE